MLPALGAVPNINHELVLKTTTNGVVFLRTSKFLTRYTGNKYSAVDINGKLWLKKSDLQKALKEGNSENKKPRIKKPGVKKNSCFSMSDEPQISENLLTPTAQFSTNEPKLLTSKKEYRVNGSQIRQRLLGFINTQKGKKELYFWTVTFPVGLPDEIAYKVFNVWLTSLRQYRLLKNYLWVAERQENGTIHYHIAVPHKMPIKKANAMMKGTLISYCKKGLFAGNIYQLRKYNGVDIAKNRKTKRVTNFAIKKGSKSLANYLSKYATKNNSTFSHLAWHNSRGYSGIFLGVTFTIDEFLHFGFDKMLHREKKLITEHFIFVPWLSNTGPPKLVTDHLYKLNSFLQNHIN